MTEKESYGIRVRFKVDGKGRLQPDPPEGNLTVAAELLPESALLSTHPGGPFSEAEELVIRCSGFESEDSAMRTGRKVQDALRVLYLYTHGAVDVGRDRVTSVLPERARDSFNQKMAEQGQEVRLYPNVHGLVVFPCDVQPVFGPSLKGTGSVAGSIDEWVEMLCGCLEVVSARQRLTEKQRTALDVFSASRFVLTPRAKLLSMVTTIEALAEPKKLDLASKKALNEISERVKAINGSGELDSFIERISNL